MAANWIIRFVIKCNPLAFIFSASLGSVDIPYIFKIILIANKNKLLTLWWTSGTKGLTSKWDQLKKQWVASFTKNGSL